MTWSICYQGAIMVWSEDAGGHAWHIYQRLWWSVCMETGEMSLGEVRTKHCSDTDSAQSWIHMCQCFLHGCVC